MANMSVRNIPDEELVELKKIAAANNRSVEAEVRHAIAGLVRLHKQKGLGTRLHAKFGSLIDQDFEFERDKSAHEPIEF